MLITLIAAFLIGLIMLFVGYRLGGRSAMCFMIEALSIVDDTGRIFDKVRDAMEVLTEEQDPLT